MDKSQTANKMHCDILQVRTGIPWVSMDYAGFYGGVRSAVKFLTDFVRIVPMKCMKCTNLGLAGYVLAYCGMHIQVSIERPECS